MIATVDANGASIPALGLGTWDIRGDAAAPILHAALDAGYRHFDTAALYGNEVEVGAALRTHSVPRSETFITTKVARPDVGEGYLQRSAEASLKRLGLEVVDLLLIHWPNRDITVEEQVRALCKAKQAGLARHIGVSNFPPAFIDEAVRVADEPIVTNQIEHHPWLDQQPTFEACARHGIAITSYSPLGQARHFDDPTLVRIAEAHGKTPAQVILRWQLQQPQNIAIPKTSNPTRLLENFDISDFTLTPEELSAIRALATGPNGTKRGRLRPNDTPR